MYDGAMAELIERLGRLPGIGPKSAQRIAFHILDAEPEDVTALADALREAGALLAALPGIDQARLGRLAQRLGARDNRDAYNAAFDLMSLHMAQRARAAAFSGAASPHAANWANAIGRVEETKSQADALNLDRSRTLLAAFHRLALELRAAH